MVRKKEDKPTAKDYLEAARESMDQATTLAGQGTLSDREFLESMARADGLLDHEDNCGVCHTLHCHAEAARQLLAEGEILDGIAKWSALSTKMWQSSKYFKLYKKERDAGRDPHKAFEKKGWEM